MPDSLTPFQTRFAMKMFGAKKEATILVSFEHRIS